MILHKGPVAIQSELRHCAYPVQTDNAAYYVKISFILGQNPDYVQFMKHMIIRIQHTCTSKVSPAEAIAVT